MVMMMHVSERMMLNWYGGVLAMFNSKAWLDIEQRRRRQQGRGHGQWVLASPNQLEMQSVGEIL